MFKEFRDFAMKGSVVDLAVGFIMGAAFSAVVTSFVNDVLMPPIGMLLGKVDFSTLSISLAEGVAIRYGLFINSVISFLIVAFVVFLLVRQVNRFRTVPVARKCPFCFSEIHDQATRCPACTSEIPAS